MIAMRNDFKVEKVQQMYVNYGPCEAFFNGFNSLITKHNRNA